MSKKLEKVLLLRTCNHNMTSYNDFKWKKSGYVKCPDWNPAPVCGGGLHGLLRGCGNVGLLNQFDTTLNWLVIEANLKDVVEIDKQKAKVPRAKVIYCGDRDTAVKILTDKYPGLPVVLGKVLVGDNAKAVVGDRGLAIAGNYGIATAGNNSKAIVGEGDSSIATAGAYGTAEGGNYATAIAGENGRATAGFYSKATTSEWGVSTTGNRGTSIAGDYGMAFTRAYGSAKVGRAGTASAGENGRVSAGENGILKLEFRDSAGKMRIKIAYVGEKNIQPDVAYKLNAKGGFVKA